MKILVTGGLGFIGSNLCRYVFSKYLNYRIINMDKLGVGANPVNLKDLENRKQYQFIKGDICDSKLTGKLIKKVDAIVNIAAETHVDRSIANPIPFIQSNTMGAFTILEGIRKYNRDVRLVHVSTDEVYGEIVDESFTENNRLRPSNPYSASKAAADMFVTAYHRTYGLDVVIIRCTNNYGPYQFPEKLIPKTIIRALRNLPIPIYGSGKDIRDWIYVQDHCEAIDLVLRNGKTGEIYNTSAGNEIPNIGIVRKILQLLDRPDCLMTFVEDRPGHDTRYSLDSSKIRLKLGWAPKFSFENALKATVDWYVNNEWWWRPLATDDIIHPTPWKLGDIY